MGCQLPRVKKFLFCLELETGGIIIGWLAAILSALAFIALTLALVLTSIEFDQSTDKTDNIKTAFIGKVLVLVKAIFTQKYFL
jgi:hypothetical protein